MKKILISVCILIISVVVYAQSYDLEKLKLTTTVWGETYLFHPSVIRSDKNLEWEKELVRFLPQIKNKMSDEAFVDTVNSGLLSKLEDPFTVIQNTKQKKSVRDDHFQSTSTYDYIRISADQLSDIGSLMCIDSLIPVRDSQKRLIIDLRIDTMLSADPHVNTFFDYFISMFIDKEIPGSQSVTREHFGWDEYNDWWFYEQRWKLKGTDKQVPDNGKIKPFPEYAGELREYWEKHPDAEQHLKTWYDIAMSSDWKTPNEVKRTYSNASILKDSRIIFNIKGNAYRLVTKFNFEKQWIFIRFIGTHQEYDQIDANTI